jgi:hypothetical protein
MRRKKSRMFEEVTAWENPESEAAWPELRAALREPEKTQDLGLWRLAEDPAAFPRRPATVVRLTPRTEPRYPHFPDAA